jgi:hypothetical protein
MRRSLKAGLALAVAGLATPLGAQTVDFSDELAQLDEAVLGLAASSSDFGTDVQDAIRLHARVVALRAEDDAARGACLMDHASLLMATDDVEGARVFVARAVAQAMNQGDELAAADASAVAALLAQQAGDLRAARIYRKNARSLALSPGLTPEQSNAIAARLYGAGWKATARGGTAVVDE